EPDHQRPPGLAGRAPGLGHAGPAPGRCRGGGRPVLAAGPPGVGVDRHRGWRRPTTGRTRAADVRAHRPARAAAWAASGLRLPGGIPEARTSPLLDPVAVS